MQSRYFFYCAFFFVLSLRFMKKWAKSFYLYISRTCSSPGGTPSVIVTYKTYAEPMTQIFLARLNVWEKLHH